MRSGFLILAAAGLLLAAAPGQAGPWSGSSVETKSIAGAIGGANGAVSTRSMGTAGGYYRRETTRDVMKSRGLYNYRKWERRGSIATKRRIDRERAAARRR